MLKCMTMLLNVKVNDNITKSLKCCNIWYLFIWPRSGVLLVIYTLKYKQVLRGGGVNLDKYD